MKKVIIIILCFVLVGIVKAETCEVISGDKNTIGSEVVCGSEHFYIVDSNQDEIKMMAKYNLYVGAIYNKINLDSSNTYVQYECEGSSYSSCYRNPKYFFEGEEVDGYSEFMLAIGQEYNIANFQNIDSYSMSNDNNAYYVFTPVNQFTVDNKTYLKKSVKLYPYTLIDEYTEGFALQNETALGVTGEKGNANYPINATVKLFPNMNEDFISNTSNYDNFVDGYTNFDFLQGSRPLEYLEVYSNKLNNMGFQVSKVDMITIEELAYLVKEITGKDLPLTTWYEESYAKEPEEDGELRIYTLGDLKEYLSVDYKWIWNTSYWTRTFVGKIDDIDNNHQSEQIYFVSSAGDICYSWSGCGGIPRAGIRPVVTMSKDDLRVSYKFIEGMGQDFNIVTNTNMKFRLNMEYEDFVNSGKVYIDDKEVSKACYKLSKGSTIITFVDDCCKEYSLGQHTIKATLNDGAYEAVTDFIISTDTPLISKVKQIIENPNTNDKLAIIMVVAFTSLILAFIVLRKELFNSKYENI